MATLPAGFEKSPQHDLLVSLGLTKVSSGKVREGWIHPSDPQRILFIATNRISIFNFVLPAFVERKGEVLVALSHFVSTHVLPDLPNDMVLTQKTPESRQIMKKWRALCHGIDWGSCTLVDKHEVQPFEAIFRRHPGGSIWPDYLETGIIAGQQLPAGITKWDRLDRALFTPTEKSEDDDAVTIQRYLELNPVHGQRVISTLEDAYNRVYEYYRRRGILVLDTKFEYGIDSQGRIVLLDEKFTPDSSRYVEEENWLSLLGSGKDPAFQDKEIVRIWGKTVETPFVDEHGKQIIGIHKLKGSNPEHIAFVHSLVVPQNLLDETSETYLHIFKRATGYDLDIYKREEMHIAA